MNDYTKANLSNGPSSVGQGGSGGAKQSRGETSKPKTPENIVLSFLGDTPIRSPGALKTYADAVAVIQAYGDQRAAEARAEQIDIPPKPTMLAHVARAIYEKRISAYSGAKLSWDELPLNQVCLEFAGARAAIEALKPKLILSGKDHAFYLSLHSILAEGQK